MESSSQVLLIECTKFWQFAALEHRGMCMQLNTCQVRKTSAMSLEKQLCLPINLGRIASHLDIWTSFAGDEVYSQVENIYFSCLSSQGWMSSIFTQRFIQVVHSTGKNRSSISDYSPHLAC
ncbi:hypothetical protein XENOCAPTIV_027489 [Xenoophorus captivus]|uniref:Uncharacterized protein n=1 Tax=Xenoophorus captivus TaxID=1517983 RepID=A0ABV0S1B9_9TELE